MSTIVGLDIGHYAIKALRLEASYRGFRAVRFDEVLVDNVAVALPSTEDGEVPFTAEELRDALESAEEEALLAALAELHEKGALDAESVAVALPPDLIMSARMSFPFTDPRQLTQVIPLQLEERSPVELTGLIIDHHIVGPSTASGGDFDIAVNAAKIEDIDIYLNLWRAGHVDPHYVLMGDAAMMHLGAYLLPEVTEPYAIIDIGHRFTRVCCVEPDPAGGGKGVRLGWARSIQIAGHALTIELQQALEYSYAEAEHFKHKRAVVGMRDEIVQDRQLMRAADALERGLRRLVRELSSTLRAHQTERRVAVTRLYVCGGSTRLAGLLPFLEAELGLPVAPLPIGGVELAGLPAVATESAADIAQALALGLREVLDKAQVSTINFRRGRFEHKGKKSWLRSQMIGLSIIGALLLLMLTAWFITSWLSLSRQVEATDKALTQATTTLFDKPTTDLAKIKRELSGVEEGTSFIPKVTAYDMFFELNSRLPADTKVALYDVRIDLVRQLVKVDGETDSAASVDRLVESYEDFVCFKGQVKKGDVEAVNEQVKFTLNISPQCTPEKPAKTSAKKDAKAEEAEE